MNLRNTTYMVTKTAFIETAERTEITSEVPFLQMNTSEVPVQETLARQLGITFGAFKFAARRFSS